MRWAARSVIPTLSAMSRNRAFGSRWTQRRTWVWLERNRLVFRCRLQSLTYES